MHCPFCKKRIGTWCRKAKSVDTLVDQKLWQRTQTDFADELQARHKGNADTLFNEGGFSHEFTFEDGAIGKEFEEQLAQLRQEDQKRRDRELADSKKLIAALQLEDQGQGAGPRQVQEVAAGNSDPPPEFLEAQRRLEAEIEQQRKDEELARKLQEQLERESDFSSNRTRASPRITNKKQKGPRQLTLEEALMPSTKRRKLQNGDMEK